MAQKITCLLPGTEALLRGLGERLRMARLRRRLPAKQVAERAGMTPMTLRNVERGGAGVTIGAYAAVLQVLGLELDFQLIAQADTLGRTLQDAQCKGPTRSRRRTIPPTKTQSENTTAAHTPQRQPKVDADAEWTHGFTTSQQLLDLIVLPPEPLAKKRH